MNLHCPHCDHDLSFRGIGLASLSLSFAPSARLNCPNCGHRLVRRHHLTEGLMVALPGVLLGAITFFGLSWMPALWRASTTLLAIGGFLIGLVATALVGTLVYQVLLRDWARYLKAEAQRDSGREQVGTARGQPSS